jgi:hypothetical protein
MCRSQNCAGVHPRRLANGTGASADAAGEDETCRTVMIG